MKMPIAGICLETPQRPRLAARLRVMTTDVWSFCCAICSGVLPCAMCACARAHTNTHKREREREDEMERERERERESFREWKGEGEE